MGSYAFHSELLETCEICCLDFQLRTSLDIYFKQEFISYSVVRKIGLDPF